MQAKPFNRGAADGNQPAVTPEDALTRHGVDVNRIESPDSSVAEVVASFGDTVFDAVHVGQDKNKTSYLIGEGPQADFPAPGDSLPDAGGFPLVINDDHGVVIQFTDGMTGRVKIGNQHFSLSELISSRRAVADGSHYRLALPPKSAARIDVGRISFRVRAVARGKQVAGRVSIEKRLWAYVGSTGVAAASLFTLLSMIPNDVLAFSLEEDAVDSRFAGYHHIADDEPEPEPTEVESDDDEQQGGTGQRAEGAEGKMGKPSATKSTGVYQIKGPKHTIPQLARNIDPEMAARQAGILGLMGKEQGHIFASVGGEAFAVGNDDDDIWGGLTGTEYGEANGVIGGLGLIGTGHGGGGNGSGTIGMGNVGTIGKGGGKGTGTGYGPGGGKGVGFKKKGVTKPKVRIAKATMAGNMDKSIIRRVVRSHINEVRSCYNQGLVRNPNLRGRVAIQFSIGGTGSVLKAYVSESSLKDDAVGRCVQKAVKRWKFPKPPGGGMVIVTYPFSMDPAV